MNDEKYVFVQDVKEKKTTARSARNKRTHNGKGGRVRLPSDNLTGKELEAMSGEVKSYKLNEPMNWQEFKAMPDDIKVSYVKLLRQRYSVPDSELAKMFGTSKDMISRLFIPLGLRNGVGRGKKSNWDKEGFYAWCHGVTVPAPAEDPVEPEEVSEETIMQNIENAAEPDEKKPVCPEDNEKVESHVAKKLATPFCGELSFRGCADSALETVKRILGGANVTLTVTWEEIPAAEGRCE